MKSPFYALALGGLALISASCSPVRPGVLGAGYDDRDAYQLGFTHGRNDSRTGRPHDPHINDPDEVPGAHRMEYTRGYVDGFGASSGYPSGTGK